MNGHNIFNTPLRPVVLMAVGLNCILGNFWLSALVGTVLYAAAAWMEQRGSRN